MNHPLFNKPAVLVWYYVFWVVLSVAQFYMDLRVFEADIAITLVDVIISNIIYSLLGMGIWYVVIGGHFESKKQIGRAHV